MELDLEARVIRRQTRSTMNRRFSRRHFVRAFGGLSAMATGTLGRRAAAAESYTMRLSMPDRADGVLGNACTRFAATVDRRSNGQLKIEIFPDGQLAKQKETIDGLTTGVIDLGIQVSAQLESLFPRFQVFDMPFLFRNGPEAYRVLDGPIGDEFFAELETKGIVGLGWATGGFKELETTSKPVIVPEDMKGLRIRIQGGAVYVALYQSLGAIPITVDLAEAFTALSQHTIDGADFVLNSMVAAKYYTIVKHVAMSNHIFSLLPVMASKRKFDALPPALQKILKEEGKAAASLVRTGIARQTADDIQYLKKNGVVFTDIQYPPFRKAVEPVRAMLQAKIGGDLFDRIDRAAS
jgi:TRAP-type transport system periplasmic protein